MIELYYLIGVTTSLGSLAGWTKNQDTIMEYVSMWVGFQDIHGCITSWNDAHELDDKWMTADGGRSTGHRGSDAKLLRTSILLAFFNPVLSQVFWSFRSLGSGISEKGWLCHPQSVGEILMGFVVHPRWCKIGPFYWQLDYIELHWKSKHVLFQYMTFLTCKYSALDTCIDGVQKP